MNLTPEEKAAHSPTPWRTIHGQRRLRRVRATRPVYNTLDGDIVRDATGGFIYCRRFSGASNSYAGDAAGKAGR